MWSLAFLYMSFKENTHAFLLGVNAAEEFFLLGGGIAYMYI